MTSKSQDVPVKVNPVTVPSNPLASLRSEIDQVFENFTRGWPSFGRLMQFDPFRTMSTKLTLPRMELSPDVDIAETDTAYEISAEIPGLDAKEINITLSDNVLTLKGEKKAEREEKKKDYYLSERSYGAFQRSFTLPNDADAEKIDTQFAKGVLKITVPKSVEAKAKTRKIEVKAA